tara:strand:- start:2368 stop:2535 length:168 start_codon:yes stop_codon:yes gene_type:complete
MKIPVGKIAKWIGRSILAALVSEAADRLSRPKPVDDQGQERGDHRDGQNDRLDPE